SGFDDDQIWVNQSTKPLINHIYNGKNENINISYEPLTNDDIYYNYRLHGSGTGSGGIGGINIFSTASLEKDYELSIPFYVVASAKMANGLGGQDTTSYIYKGYRVNRYRGPLGFYEIYSYHSQKKELEYTKYKQNFPFIGLPSERINYLNSSMPIFGSIMVNPGGVKASIKDYTYEDKSYTLNSKMLHQVYAKSVVGKMYDPDSTNLLVTQTDSKVLSEDHLGNIESQTQTTLDHTTDKTHKTTETYEYDNDTANWIIGKVTQLVSTAETLNESDTKNTVTQEYTYDGSTGALNTQKQLLDDDQYLLKSYAYTSTGNVESETLSGTDIDTLTTTYTYGYADKFRISAEKTVDGATFNETFAYDPRFGEVTTYTDPNGHETYVNYNALGQKEIQTNPDGSKVEWYYAWGGATNALYAITTIDDTKPYITRYYDLLDREVLLKTHDLDGNIILQKKQYNAKGLLSQSSLPYISGDTEPAVAYSYDNYGRLTKLTKPSPSGDGQSVETTSYSAFQLVQTDGEGYKKKTVKNALGQTIKVVEGLGSSDESALSYRYDGLGNLIEAVDSASNTITYRYDNMGRKIYESDPDRGIHTYKYDVLGNMIYEADARGTEKTYSYDALSRLKSVDAQNSADSISKVITHTYDDKTNGIGELSTIHTQSLIDSEQSETQSEYYYDELSRLSKKSSIIDEETHSIEYRYDNASRVKGVYVHDALGVDFNTYYVYKNGFLFGIKNPENKTTDTSTLGYVYYADQRDAWGNVVDEIFGNGVSTQKTYNNAGYLNEIYVRHALGYAGLHAINYNYDHVGNVIERKNTFSQEHYYMDETFTYDALRRINSMNVVVKPIPTVHLTGNTSLSAQSISMNSESEKIYRYDAIGNILQKGSINDYSYSSTKPHAVESANGKSYTYDANGNMLSRGDETIAYTAFDKPYALTNANGETTKFYYDGNNNRYKKKTSSYETLYLDKIYERKLYSGGGTDEYTGYFYFGDKLVAMQILQGESKTKSYRYVHTDSLDSISLITDENGDIVEQRSYEPFGEIRSMDYGNGIVPTNTTNITNRSFTNHEQIGEMEGLIHMDGRVYDATIGRFLSADIHVPHPYSTQSYNRYSYVRNNPLGFTDPSGYTDLENTPGNSAIPNQGDTVPDTTPNGSVSFTEAGVIAKERQEYIIERARYILKNPRNLPKAYINKLQNIVDTNKLLYEEDYMRKVKLPDGTYGFASVYGTASIRTDTIRLTKLIWQNFERKVQKGKQLSKQDLIKQIDYVIVHELQHVVRQEDEHLPTRTIFESRINKWGWKERY
ncbi:MAG: RHS repeat-associated core domain-containing protein, partial [Sulfurovaceae bacterium]